MILDRLRFSIGLALAVLVFSSCSSNSRLHPTAGVAASKAASGPPAKPGASKSSNGARFKVESSGAATYTIPISVPPGTRKVEPSLSLSYDSQSGNGQLGVGWDLSGLSQITRCNATYASDGFSSGVDYDANDRFCIDGSRLKNVSTSTPYYQDGSVYHTQIESWRKVVAHAKTDGGATCGSGPCWFSVTLKDGTELEYGRATSSRFDALDAPGQKLFGAGGSKQGSVRAWALGKLTDRHGNYVTFTYTNSPTDTTGTAIAGAGNVGDYYIARIDYTANDGASPALAAQRSVQFAYAKRTDATTQYQGGARVTTAARLAKVSSCLSSGSISNLACNVSGVSLVASYALTYCDQDSSCSASFVSRTGRSVLYSIVECGADGTSCLPPTVFGWQTGSNTVKNINGPSNDLGTTLASCPSPAVTSWADFNGDGFPDWICNDLTNTGTVTVLLTSVQDGKASMAPPSGAANGQLTSVTAKCNGSARWSDFTASGDVDWVCTDTGGYFYVLQSTGTTLAPTTYGDALGSGTPGKLRGTDNATYVNALCPSGGNVAWADFNGDGFEDWICATGTNGNYQVYVLVSNGQTLTTLQQGVPNGLSTITAIQVSAWCPNTPTFRWIDFNGDGMADFTCSDPSSGTVSVFQSTGTSLVSANPADPTSGQVSQNAACQGNQQISWADINGDGLPDWTCVDTASGQVSTLVGTGASLVNPDPAASNPAAPASVALGCGGDSQARPGWADFNGDGLSDLVCYALSLNALYAQLSSGTALQLPQAAVTTAASCGSGAAGWLDLNADRLVDWVCNAPGTGQIQSLIDNPLYPDLASTVTNGLGGQVTVSYAPLTSTAVYAQSAQAAYPRGKVLGFPGLYVLDRVPLYVVSSYTQNNGASRNQAAYSYSYDLFYTNGVIGLLGLGWQGFQTMTVRDRQLANNLSVAFLQDFPFTGRPRRAAACTSTAASQQCASSTNTLLLDGKASYFCESNAKECNQDPRFIPQGAGVGIYQVLSTHKSAKNTSTGSVVEELYEHDTYGNQLLQASLGDVANGGKPLYTCESFSNDTTNWRIGFTVDKKQSTKRGCPASWSSYTYDSANDLSWTQTAYGAQQDVLSVVRWDDQHNGWLGKMFGRDGRGLGNITSVSATNQAGSSPTPNANSTYTIAYDTTFATFPASVTTPLADPSKPGSALVKSFAYDARFGARVGTIDANGAAALSCPDAFGVTGSTQGPRYTSTSGTDTNCLGAQAFYAASGVPAAFTGATVTTLSTTAWAAGMLNGGPAIYSTVTTRTAWDDAFASAHTRWKQTFVDGLGRTYRVVIEGDQQATATEVQYVTKKQVKRVSLPHAATGDAQAFVTFAYDSYGRKTQMTLPYSGGAGAQPAAQPCNSDDITTTTTTCWTYGAKNTVTRTDAANTNMAYAVTQQYALFNNKKQPTTLTNQGGAAVTRFDYDGLGRPRSVEDPLGASLTVTRDSLGHPLTVASTSNGTLTNTYDVNGLLASFTDAAGHVTKVTYDGLGRRRTQSLYRPSGKSQDELVEVVDLVYDGAGPAGGGGLAYQKGRLSRVSTVDKNDPSASSSYAYGYDPYGSKNAATLTFAGQSSNYTGASTPSGLPLQVTTPDANGTTLTYQYSDVGWLTSITATTKDNSTPKTLVTYGAHTLLGLPLSVTYESGVVESYAYSPLGQVTSHGLAGAGMTTANLLANAYVWTPLGQIAQTLDCTSAANQGNARCAVFPAGTAVGSGDASETFTYQDKRLASASSAQYGSPTYQYHANGNVTQMGSTTFQYRKAGSAETYEVASGSDGLSARYDRTGNMIWKRTSGGDTWNYAYDAHGRLTEARKNRVLVQRNVYDHTGARLQKITYTSDGKSVAATTTYVGPNVIRGSGGLRGSGGSAETVYLLDAEGNVVGARSGGGAGYAFHANPMTRSVERVTDGKSGALVSSILYQPFGAVAQVTPQGSDVIRPGFQGHEHDPAIGLDDLGARFYDPAIGRFVSADKGLGGGPTMQDALNRYAMVLNDPVRLWDPDGRSACGVMKGIATAGSSALIGGVTVMGTPYMTQAWEQFLYKSFRLFTAAIAGYVGYYGAGKLCKKWGWQTSSEAEMSAMRAQISDLNTQVGGLAEHLSNLHQQLVNQDNGNGNQDNGNGNQDNGNENQVNGNENQNNGNEDQVNGNEDQVNGNENQNNGNENQDKGLDTTENTLSDTGSEVSVDVVETTALEDVGEVIIVGLAAV